MNPRRGHFPIARTIETQTSRLLTSLRLEVASNLLNLIMAISQTKAVELQVKRAIVGGELQIVELQRLSSITVEMVLQMLTRITFLMLRATRTISLSRIGTPARSRLTQSISARMKAQIRMAMTTMVSMRTLDS